jgi:hypothetical protein
MAIPHALKNKKKTKCCVNSFKVQLEARGIIFVDNSAADYVSDEFFVLTEIEKVSCVEPRRLFHYTPASQVGQVAGPTIPRTLGKIGRRPIPFLYVRPLEDRKRLTWKY